MLSSANMPHALPKIPKWNNILWAYFIMPSLPLSLVFGALIPGNSRHFRSAHGVRTQSLFSLELTY